MLAAAGPMHAYTATHLRKKCTSVKHNDVRYSTAANFRGAALIPLLKGAAAKGNHDLIGDCFLELPKLEIPLRKNKYFGRRSISDQGHVTNWNGLPFSTCHSQAHTPFQGEIKNSSDSQFSQTFQQIPWGRIHVGRVGYPLPTLPSRTRPLNTEGAVGAMRRVTNKRLAVKRRVACLAVMNTVLEAVFVTAG